MPFHERHLFLAGHIRPRSEPVSFGWCPCCGRTVMVENVRSWPRDMVVRGGPAKTGECRTCHSTIAPYPDPPAAA